MNFLDWAAFVVTMAGASGMLLRRDWRWSIALLAAAYLGVFWLVQSPWSISLAAVKLVTGWMVCAALAIAHRNAEEEAGDETAWPQGQLFRLAVIGLVLTVTFAGGIGLASWLGMSLPAAWGGLMLISMGLLHLGVTGQSFRVVLGLLTALAGFEVIYAAVESSALVAGLLALVNLGLAMVGAYFLPRQPEREQP
ncbi:MAG: hypothetical protein AB1531_04570 [Chloroflexota bacterium]